MRGGGSLKGAWAWVLGSLKSHQLVPSPFFPGIFLSRRPVKPRENIAVSLKERWLKIMDKEPTPRKETTTFSDFDSLPRSRQKNDRAQKSRPQRNESGCVRDAGVRTPGCSALGGLRRLRRVPRTGLTRSAVWSL